MTIPKIKEVQEALQEFQNEYILINDQILNVITGNPITTYPSNKGYLLCYYKGFQFYYHRLVFFLHSGLWPDVVDHIDRDTYNNAPSNLRAATKQQNNQNAGIGKNNTSGFKGVSFLKDKKSKPFRAIICYCNTTKHIGYFDTAEEAALAYDVFAKVCFGDFAVLNNKELFYQRVNERWAEIEQALKS